MAHFDLLAHMDQARGVTSKLQALLDALRTRHPTVERMAVALFDESLGRVRAAYHATVGGTPLPFYEADLAMVPGLKTLRGQGTSRVIQDLSKVEGGRPHTQALLEAGFRASYTLPLTWDGHFEGFVFFDSRQANSLSASLLAQLDVAGRLAGAVALADLQASRTLQAAVLAATRMVHTRDPETGGHLQRMAHFSRLIAVSLAKEGVAALDEDAVEHIFAFAPMHDLGKIGIPDQVLFKPSPLNAGEQLVMHQHPALGRRLVDDLLASFGLVHLPQAELLRQIAEGHHEKRDGSGYPKGLQDGQVPLSARIVAVADVFDALTSERPYKPAWDNFKAMAFLEQEARMHLDPACVAALVCQPEAVLRIQNTFRDQ